MTVKQSCWTTVQVAVEQSCQWLLDNRASDCWKIVPARVETILPATVKEFCQLLLNNHASDCWTITPVTVEQLWQWLFNNCKSDCSTFVPIMKDYANRAGGCCKIAPVTVEQPCQRETERERGTYSKVKSKSGVKWILNILFVIFFKMQKKHRNCLIPNYQSCLCYFLSKKGSLFEAQRLSEEIRLVVMKCTEFFVYPKIQEWKINLWIYFAGTKSPKLLKIKSSESKKLLKLLKISQRSNIKHTIFAYPLTDSSSAFRAHVGREDWYFNKPASIMDFITICLSQFEAFGTTSWKLNGKELMAKVSTLQKYSLCLAVVIVESN